MSDIRGKALSFGSINTRDLAPQVENLTLKGGDGKIDATFSAVDAAYASLVKYYVVTANTHMPQSPSDGVSVMVMPGTGTLSCVLSGLTNGVVHHVRVFIRCTYGWQTSPMAYGVATPMAGIALSTIAASDAATEQIVMLPEQGIPVKFILLKHDYENSGASLVCRKDIYDLRAVGGTYYLNSNIDNWLNATYMGLLAQNIQSNISTVTIPYTASRGSIGQMSARIFLLSRMELGGGSDPYALAEGIAIPYFNSGNRRISHFNGVETTYYTRTYYSGKSGYFWCSRPDTEYFVTSNESEGSRPAFCLASDMLFIPNPDGSYSPLTA